MHPLTTESWTGLPLYRCPAGREVRLVDVALGENLLVLWRSSGSMVEVRRSAEQRWTYTSRAGRCDFVAAGRFESIACSAPAAPLLIVGLPDARVQDLLGAAGRGLPWESHFQLQQRSLVKLVGTLEDHHRRDEPLGAAYTRALSAVIVHRLAAMAQPPGAVPAPRGADASHVIPQLIENQLDNVPALQDLAALAGMNTNQFLKWFRREFGVTPHQYVMRRRVERAMHVLDTQDAVSLTTLALQLGFNSHAHFTSVFRSQTGRTPSGYRAPPREMEPPRSSVAAPRGGSLQRTGGAGSAQEA
jgi:AraC family transcriptional regulator